MSNHSKAAQPKNKMQLNAIYAAGAVAVIGLALWIFQLAGGMQNTNMRNLDSWGLYIISFMLFVGLSAGGLIISSVPKVFGMKSFGQISKVAIWVSIVCTVLAMGFVIVDLGGPLGFGQLLQFQNMGSPLLWDVIVLVIYLVLSIFYLRATILREKGRGSERALRVLSAFALITAVLVHTVTAWIFGLQVAHEFWYTALLGPWFVSSALVSGLALVLVIVIALRKVGYLKPEHIEVKKMLRLLGVFTAVDLYFFGCELLTAGFPKAGASEMVALLTTGSLAPFFWFEVLAGIFTLLVAFVPKLRQNGLIVTVGILSILAIFCKRIQLLLGGFSLPNLEFPAALSGPPLSNSGAAMQGLFAGLIYAPSPLEIGVWLGILGLGVFGILLGLRLLPLQPMQPAKSE